MPQLFVKVLTIESIKGKNLYTLSIEIYNNSSEYISSQKINITFYDRNDKIIHSTEVLISNCPPKKTVKFKTFLEKKKVIGCRYKILQQ